MIFEKSQFFSYFIIEAILFALVFSLGIGSAYQLKRTNIYKSLGLPHISFFNFISGFIFITFLFFLLIRTLRRRSIKTKIYKGIFVFTSFFASAALLEIWISKTSFVFVVILLIIWWLKKPNVLNQNILMGLSIASMGSFFGFSIKPQTMVGLLYLFSLYDIIAVYKTKHMIEMAKDMVEQKVIFGFVIPPTVSSFFQDLKEVQAGGNFLILGAGDITFPLLFATSLIPESLLKAIIVAIFSFVGLFFTFFLFSLQKSRHPIPALPPIAICSIFGFLITRLF